MHANADPIRKLPAHWVGNSYRSHSLDAVCTKAALVTAPARPPAPQVINHACPSWTATLEEGSGGVLRLGTGSWASEHLIPVAALTDPQLGFVVGDRLLIRVEARYC